MLSGGGKIQCGGGSPRGSLENPRPVPNSVHAASMMSRCTIVDVNEDPAHTMTLVSLMEEEYEKNTSYAAGLVDYRAAGLLVSGCKRGKEHLERPVQSSYQEQVLVQPLPETVTVWDTTTPQNALRLEEHLASWTKGCEG